MARALVITHTESEDPGTLVGWLGDAGVELDVLEPWRGDALPDRVTHDALIVMGGPQQAYDESSAPWLAATKELMRQAVAGGLPLLGVCLGGQLLAEALGGVVEPGDTGPELGARLVARRDVAEQDPIMWDLPMAPVVVQWHWDAITELPPGAVLLASSTRYPHQAFRVGSRAWGLQFHIEVTPEMVTRWATADADGVRAAGLDPEAVLAKAVSELGEVEDVWRQVVVRFATLAGGRASDVRKLPRTSLPVLGG